MSEFAGAAEELTDALLVNPYNADEISERLRQAVEMEPAEQSRLTFSFVAKLSHKPQASAICWDRVTTGELHAAELRRFSCRIGVLNRQSSPAQQSFEARHCLPATTLGG